MSRVTCHHHRNASIDVIISTTPSSSNLPLWIVMNVCGRRTHDERWVLTRKISMYNRPVWNGLDANREERDGPVERHGCARPCRWYVALAVRSEEWSRPASSPDGTSDGRDGHDINNQQSTLTHALTHTYNQNYCNDSMLPKDEHILHSEDRCTCSSCAGTGYP